MLHALFTKLLRKVFPNRGRPGRVELPLSPLPFVVVYRVREDAVEIARLLHGAQALASDRRMRRFLISNDRTRT
ncbi:MAG: type II toxin-antitoxin system RelE/ParE family toxin [Acidobacteriia bacterium]|nr:type II toxin-antitoxin system RelE/ParE family toxin [Terriglobia bacterium]